MMEDIEFMFRLGRTNREICQSFNISRTRLNGVIKTLRNQGLLPPAKSYLTRDDVAEIRRLYNSGDVLVSEIARMYGVGRCRVARIAKSAACGAP